VSGLYAEEGDVILFRISKYSVYSTCRRKESTVVLRVCALRNTSSYVGFRCITLNGIEFCALQCCQHQIQCNIDDATANRIGNGTTSKSLV
jgi:hypothetical protein